MKFYDLIKEEEVEKVGNDYVNPVTKKTVTDETKRKVIAAERKSGVTPTPEFDMPVDFKIFRDRVDVYDPKTEKYVNVLLGSNNVEASVQDAVQKQDFKKDVLDAKNILLKGINATPQEKGILLSISKKYSTTKPSFIQDIAKVVQREKGNNER